MRAYKVGGYVRDTLLGLKPNDIDWVVVGETPESMIDKGFKRVGADFPVFLNNEGEEYALARTERKTGNGYTGFETVFDPSISLIDDLKRRDLSINSMAINDETKELIDPFNGQNDLEEGILRHVSEAFSEDPVRVLRVARFAAKYNFKVAKETKELMREIARNGELNFLTKERVWQEFEKMLKSTDNPQIFFKVLKHTKALKHIFPPLRDIDFSNLPTIKKEDDIIWRFCKLFYNVDKFKIDELHKILCIPNNFMMMFKRMNIVCNFIEQHVWVRESNNLMVLFKECNAFQDPYNFLSVLELIRSIGIDVDRLGRPKGEEWLNIMHDALLEAVKYGFKDLSNVQQKLLKGKDISIAINTLQRQKIEKNILFIKI